MNNLLTETKLVNAEARQSVVSYSDSGIHAFNLYIRFPWLP